MSAKLEAAAKEEATHIAQLTRSAALSKSYLYPLKGIPYLLTHRSLQTPLRSRLAPTLTLATGIVTSMFFFTYLPQVAALAFVEGPAAPVAAVPLVLSESSTLINAVARSFLIEEALVDTFDGTLVAKGREELVKGGREVKRGGDPIGRLGRLIKKPFKRFTPTALVRYLMYLPLNLIPVVGTVLFIFAQGKRRGPEMHERYFQLKGLSGKRRDQWMEEQSGAYTSFGIAANLLELIPVVGIFFAFTNQVGAALWAADLEKGQETVGEDVERKSH